MAAHFVISRWLTRGVVAAFLVATVAAGPLCSTARAQSFTPLTTFGSNGWLAPDSIPQLDNSNSQRGIGVSPLTGNVILVDRDSTLGNNAYVLNGTTGAVSGTLAPPAGGYSGGTFVVSLAGVGADGAVYVANLATSAAAAFRVYRWASDSDFVTPATVAFSGTFTGGAPRYGDSFAVFGSGTAAKFAAAGSNDATANRNSYFAVGSLSGTASQTSSAFVQVVNSQTTTAGNNGYRLGLSFMSGTSLLGTQGTQLYSTTFDSTVTSNIVSTSTTSWAAADRPLAYLSHNGTPYVATVNTNSSTVSLFDITDPTLPAFKASGNATVGTPNGNLNGAGAVGWGPYLGNDQYLLYALNSNNGIQAFTVTVPEPSTWALLATAAGVGGMTVLRNRPSSRRRRRSSGVGI